MDLCGNKNILSKISLLKTNLRGCARGRIYNHAFEPLVSAYSDMGYLLRLGERVCTLDIVRRGTSRKI